MARELLQLPFPTLSLETTTTKKTQTTPPGGRLSELSSMHVPMLLALLLCYAGGWLLWVASAFCTAPPSSLLALLGSLLAHLGTGTFDLSAVPGGKAVPLSDNSLSPQPCWAQVHFAALCSLPCPRATLLPLLSTTSCRSIPEECGGKVDGSTEDMVHRSDA